MHGPYRITEITKRPQGTVYTCYSPKDGNFADYHASIVQAHPCETDLEAVKSAVGRGEPIMADTQKIEPIMADTFINF